MRTYGYAKACTQHISCMMTQSLAICSFFLIKSNWKLNWEQFFENVVLVYAILNMRAY